MENQKTYLECLDRGELLQLIRFRRSSAILRVSAQKLTVKIKTNILVLRFDIKWTITFNKTCTKDKVSFQKTTNMTPKKGT